MRSGRPLSIAVLAFVYLAVGIAGFFFHGYDFLSQRDFGRDLFYVELTEATAVLCGVVLLLRRNWARWVACAWMLFHVVLSGLDGKTSALAVHLVFFAVISWILFRSAASPYFEPGSTA